MKGKKSELSPALKALRTFVIVLVLFLVYAYATQATEINLEEPLDQRRQETTVRVLRALVRPDFFTYDEEIRGMNITISMPCGDVISGGQTTIDTRLVVLAPNCASTTQDVLKLSGEGFRPNTDGIIRWYPPGDIATTRALSTFHADAEGNFLVEITMPDIREGEGQRIEIEEKWRTGITGLSDTSITVLEKILETILLALLATTIGTILAIPLSFIASRNLMINVGSPLAAIMAGIIALPIGYVVSTRLMRLLLDGVGQVGQSPWINLVGALFACAAAVAIVRLGPSILSDETQPTSQAVVALARIAMGVILTLVALAFLAVVGQAFGGWLADRLGWFDFIGNFIALVSEFMLVASPIVLGIITATVAANFGSRYGQEAVLRLGEQPARLLTVALTGVGTFVLVYGIARALNWLYIFDDPRALTLYPAAILGAIAAGLAFFVKPKRTMPIGFFLYTLVRSIFNIIRSIEPLVYVIIFAVWVGIGPFAGVLALTIHTVAALGKLFSEQVEGIAEGPLEAITATGANRLQMIMFAVIPQIVPPYIAFTLYRWDINVRMSTIIGFGGGGGIGFVLAQWINLLQYRQASVAMIAIAIVVMTLDYVSSKVRARIL